MHLKMASWVSQVNDATGFLKRLYIGLKDRVQRDRAAGAGAFARERSKRLGRGPSTTHRPWLGLPPEQAERVAWICTVRGLLGLNILVALGDASNGEDKAGPLYNRLNQELGLAVQGFATAFPREMVELDLDKLCEEVIDDAAEVADSAWRDVQRVDECTVNLNGFLKEEWLMSLKPALHQMLESL